MKKVFVVNGGAGRVICSLPAFQKYYKHYLINFGRIWECIALPSKNNKINMHVKNIN